MRILVTGAGGFVGRHVVRQLAMSEHQVIATDRTSASLARIAPRGEGRVSMMPLDLEEATAVRSFFLDVQPEAVIHLAWYASPVDYLVSPENLRSLAMTNRLVEAALVAGCRKFVMAGTCVEYALQGRPLVETDPIDPRSVYGACKHGAWLVARALASGRDTEVSWARIFHIHGPGENERRLIPWLAGELRAGRPVELTDGKQIRDHLHVADVAAGLVTLLQPGATGPYNVASGLPVSLRSVLETVGDILGRPELLHFGARPHRSDETMFLAGDSHRLRALGWAPRFDLKDGLLDTLAERVG